MSWEEKYKCIKQGQKISTTRSLFKMAISEQKKNVALGILDFLKTSIDDGTVSGDDKESVDVAIECISDVFGVELQDKAKVFGNENLVSLYERFAKLKTTEDSTSSTPETEDKKVEDVSEEAKKEAENHKIDGNRLMGQRKFQEAVECYTKAIEANPNNEIYFSNRSAAYSSLRECNKAVEDARKAIDLNPSYSKAYSRLGLALYSLGDAQGAMKAYEDGIKAEGDNPSDGMRRGYETAKKRVQEELEASVPSDDTPQGSRSVSNNEGTRDSGAGASGAGAGGLPDLSALGNMDLGSLMNNPQIANMARNMMNNPNMANMMNDPSIQGMMNQFRSGEMPDMSQLMNNPMIQNMASMFGGGAGGAGANGGNNNNNNNGGNSN